MATTVTITIVCGAAPAASIDVNTATAIAETARQQVANSGLLNTYGTVTKSVTVS